MKKKATKARTKSAIRAIEGNRLDKVELILENCPELLDIVHPRKNKTIRDYMPGDSSERLFRIIVEVEKRGLENSVDASHLLKRKPVGSL